MVFLDFRIHLDNGLMSNYNVLMKKELVILQISRIRDKANSFLTRELARRNLKGIAPSHGDILWALFTYGDLPMKKLSEIINRDKSTVTALVNKLIKSGYILRRTHESDSRSSIISLTEKGKAMQKNFWDVSEALRNKAYQGLTDEEMETLMNLLAKIHDNF
jgi:DNA-binding MarR family transcriptional regulator